MSDQSASIITQDPPNVPTVGARPYWLPDTRGFLAASIVFLIFVIVMTLMWHPVPLTEQQSALLYTVLGILLGCFKDVYGFSFNSTQAGEDKNKTIASMGASLANSVPASLTVSSPAPIVAAATAPVVPDPSKRPIDPLIIMPERISP